MMGSRAMLGASLGVLLAVAAAGGEPGAAQPEANPIQPAGSAPTTAPGGAAKSPAHVRIKVLRPTEEGEREVILEAEERTVTVRETKKEFSVAVEKAGAAAELSSAPNREEFEKKFPELWKRWAEPALDASDPDKLAVEAMVRQLLPQVLADFAKANGREPTPEERAEADKLLREEVRKALQANRAKGKSEEKSGEKGEGG